VYNSLSQLTSATNPESGTITYTYDNDGILLTKTAPKPNQTGSQTVTTTYTYDQLHRLTGKSYNDGSTPAVSYWYDQTSFNGVTIQNGKGRRTGMIDAAGQQAWSFDPMGRVVKDRRKTNGTFRLFDYQHNEGGSIKTITYPDSPGNRVVEYHPTGAGRYDWAKDIGSSINYVTGALYAPHGAVGSLTNGASLVSTYFYSNRLQPCRVSAKNSGSSPANCTSATVGNVLDLAYNFDSDPAPGVQNNGNAAKITNKRTPANSQNFTYDELNRIRYAWSDGNL